MGQKKIEKRFPCGLSSLLASAELCCLNSGLSNSKAHLTPTRSSFLYLPLPISSHQTSRLFDFFFFFLLFPKALTESLRFGVQPWSSPSGLCPLWLRRLETQILAPLSACLCHSWRSMASKWPWPPPLLHHLSSSGFSLTPQFSSCVSHLPPHSLVPFCSLPP